MATTGKDVKALLVRASAGKQVFMVPMFPTDTAIKFGERLIQEAVHACVGQADKERVLANGRQALALMVADADKRAQEAEAKRAADLVAESEKARIKQEKLKAKRERQAEKRRKARTAKALEELRLELLAEGKVMRPIGT